MLLKLLVFCCCISSFHLQNAFTRTQYTAFRHNKSGKYLDGSMFAHNHFDNNQQLFQIYQLDDANVVIFDYPWFDTPYQTGGLEIEGGCHTNVSVSGFHYYGYANQHWRLYSDGTIGSACDTKNWRLTVLERGDKTKSGYQMVIDTRYNHVPKEDLVWIQETHTRLWYY